MSNKKFKLLKDIVIPKGTIFENCDGMTSHFSNDNYLSTIGLTKNTSGRIIYGIDSSAACKEENAEWFEEVK
jgi:hypothetical protein